MQFDEHVGEAREGLVAHHAQRLPLGRLDVAFEERELALLVAVVGEYGVQAGDWSDEEAVPRDTVAR